MPSMAKTSAEPPALEGVLGFLRLLWALDHGLQLVSKRMEMQRGVTGQQRLIIRIVASSPRISPGQLAEVMHLHPSTVTGLIRRLERRGLVKRQPDATDRRRINVSLTEAGRRAGKHGSDTVEALVAKALAIFPAAKIEATEEVLRALGNVLGRAVES